MPPITVTQLDDPRLAPFRNLPGAPPARHSETFIAEGWLLVTRLLASAFPTLSVLVRDTAVDKLLPLVPPDVPIYVAPHAVLNQIVGFRFHQGALACGRRRPWKDVQRLLPADDRPLTLVVCPRIQDPDNLGQILRNSAALGVDLVLLGAGCADPFSRRTLRVSMGAPLRLPLSRSRDLRADLLALRDGAGIQLAAAVLDPRAEPLPAATRPARFGLLFGNEYDGLDAATLELCQRQITLPMPPGTDSLNVATATGIFLYHFAWQAGPTAHRRPGEQADGVSHKGRVFPPTCP